MVVRGSKSYGKLKGSDIYHRCGVLVATAHIDNLVANVFIGWLDNGSPVTIAHGQSRPSVLIFALRDASIYLLHTMRVGWRSKGDVRGNECKHDEEQGGKARHDSTRTSVEVKRV